MKPAPAIAVASPGLVIVSLSLVAVSLGLNGCTPESGAVTGPVPAKLVVEVAPISNLMIEVPAADNDGAPIYDFGPDFRNTIVEKLGETGRYLIVEPAQGSPQADAAALPASAPPESWSGVTLPAGNIKISVDAMTFTTGARGDRMFYGFDERFKTPFNDGSGALLNEFPLRPIVFEPNWFDQTFDDRGLSPFDSQAGLDLGQGFSVYTLYADLGMKWALYRSEIHLRVELDAPLAGRDEFKKIQVSGTGYYFDVSGGYLQYSGAISIARRDAMMKAFQNAASGTLASIDQMVRTLPFTARINGVDQNGLYQLNTGENSNIPAGTIYAVQGFPAVQIQVSASVPSGSLGKLISGDPTLAAPGQIVVQLEPGTTATAALAANVLDAIGGPVFTGSETVSLAWANFPKADLLGLGPQQSWWQDFLNSLIETPFLLYRIWRYFQYDQPYQNGQGDLGDPNQPDDRGSDQKPNQKMDESASPAITTAASARDWSAQAKKESGSAAIGFSTLGDPSGSGPVVAVIDSGIDYNHPVIQGSVWINPDPMVDADGAADRNGWDFISGDARPYDDGYHGTETSSVLLAIAPNVTLMPLKIFNPWGITNSASIYGAFTYAVDHGARIILCGWATRLYSRAVEMGVKYAQTHGVLVVAEAGDRGDNLAQVAAYPAVHSMKYDNVLTVTSVTNSDQLVTVLHLYASYDPNSVMLAAPGENILVADPRGHTSHQTSTAFAAAMVAGAVARNISAGAGSANYHDLIKQVESQADVVPGLGSAVRGGLRLHIRE